jgi:hypothetical protein
MDISRTHPRLIVCAFAFALAGMPSAAPAQVSPVSFDAVVSADGDTGSHVARKSTAWIDLFGAVRLADGLDLRARPVFLRRSFDGQWQTQVYELALRYERPGTVGLRMDVGQFSSPIGLSILENRPDVNPVVSQHSTLYLPVPRVEPGIPTTMLLAASYPLGAQLTLSGRKWDARAAIVDTSPIRNRPFFGRGKPPRLMNTVVGGGITPRTGVRLGATFAWGAYASSREVRSPLKGNREATLAQVEGEWSFGYTRIAGEWLWTRRETAIPDDADADGGWIEAVQTLSPRWFTAIRFDNQSTAWTNQLDGAAREEYYRRLETAVGLRLSPDLTLRASYLTRKGYVVFFWDDQFLASVVWARKFK